MLKCVLAYEQVPPAFLKVLYAFGEQEGEPNDVGLAGFGCDSAAPRTYPRLADGGRSDRTELETCQWYLVRSVERGDEPEATTKQPWRTRQVAVYHSFDFHTGRSFFLTIKANGLLREQIQQHCNTLLANPWTGKGRSRNEMVAKALEIALATHLVNVSWCCRHWGEFINESRSYLRPILDRAATLPIDGDLGALAEDVESGQQQRVVFGWALRHFQFVDLQRLSSRHGRNTEAMLAVAEAEAVIKSMRRHFEDAGKKAAESKGDEGGIFKIRVDPVVDRFCNEVGTFSEMLGRAREQLKVLDCKINKSFELVSSASLPTADMEPWLMFSSAATEGLGLPHVARKRDSKAKAEKQARHSVWEAGHGAGGAVEGLIRS